MLKVGITGGIGSGKSFVCSIFQHLGIPVYSADIRAKILSDTNTEVIDQIKAAFGIEAYKNGSMNRPFIASIVFNNKEKLNLLNSIIHPAVEQDYLNWCNQNSSCAYTLKEAAILFESGSYKMLDKTIAIIADTDIRIERVVKRDSVDADEVRKRIQNQWPTEKIKTLTDFILLNNNNNLILPQIIEIDKKLREYNLQKQDM